ncbi:MAG: DUF72 domain-containing protein [Methanomassiliicoccales archaeon]
MRVLVGCSGWAYSDWVGAFYPPELGGRQHEWLSYYSKFFSTAEVNSTFYAIPPKRLVEGWIERVSAIDFEFSLKLPSDITHTLLPTGKEEEIDAVLNRFKENCIQPIARAGRLGEVLIQLSPAVRYPEHLNNVMVLLEKTSAMAKCAIEFRHHSWVEGREVRGDVLDILELTGTTSVMVDSPAFPATSAITSGRGYVRFHGRNRDIWYTGTVEGDRRINRYDYLYSRRELAEWLPKIKDIIASTSETRIYFNNHGRAKGARNALELMDMLSIPHASKKISISDQTKLLGFA